MLSSIAKYFPFLALATYSYSTFFLSFLHRYYPRHAVDTNSLFKTFHDHRCHDPGSPQGVQTVGENLHPSVFWWRHHLGRYQRILRTSKGKRCSRILFMNFASSYLRVFLENTSENIPIAISLQSNVTSSVSWGKDWDDLTAQVNRQPSWKLITNSLKTTWKNVVWWHVEGRLKLVYLSSNGWCNRSNGRGYITQITQECTENHVKLSILILNHLKIV